MSATPSSSSRVSVERRGRVGIITMRRPEVRNAVDELMTVALESAVDELENDADCWALVIAAEGPVFCAGADLQMVSRGGTAVTERGGFAGITARPRVKPLIAAVGGPALAGGFELVLACDLVVASADASFGIPEVRRGLIAAAGGAVRLPHRLPRNVAVELALTGGVIPAVRAHALGLVNRISAGDVVDAAVELAEEIVANPPVAVRTVLELVRRSADDGEPAGWAFNEQAMAIVQASEDFVEGPRAFLEKRPPVWTGR